MKVHSLTFYSIAALLAFNLSSTKESVELPISRMPASEVVEAATSATAISVVNLTIAMPEQKELDALKLKLANLEKQLDNKKAHDQKISQANKKELADLKASIKESEAKVKAEELAAGQVRDAKADSLQKELADLKLAMEDSKKKSSEELQTTQCNSKRHETELNEQIKKQLKDKEDILLEFESFKKEMKVTKETKDLPPPALPVAPVQSGNSDIIALMAQITSMFQSQMQMQMQMQTQMFSMFQQQSNYNPYSQPMLGNSLSNVFGGMGGYGIGMGMGGYNSMSQNPYAAIPMERAQIPFDSGFNFGSIPAPAPTFGGGFNFSNNLPAMSGSFDQPILARTQVI